MSMVRCVSALFATAGVVAVSVVPAQAQAQANCTGKNLIEAMKTARPDEAAALRKAADAVENGKTLLWKIEHPDGPNRGISYLYGTISVTDDRVLKPTAAVRTALGSVRRVAVEVADVSTERQIEGMTTLAGAGKLFLADQGLLPALLTQAEGQVTEKLLQRAGLSGELAARVQPWAALALMATSDCERSRMAAGRLPLESDIARRAEDRGIGAVDLETVETQFAMLADVPVATQLALLKAKLFLAPQQNDNTETMIQLFLARDVGAMWPLQVALGRQAGVDGAVFDAYHEHVIVARNKHMGNRLYPHLSSGGVFVAVGALHLPGPTGLVAQIKDMGFKITPIE